MLKSKVNESYAHNEIWNPYTKKQKNIFKPPKSKKPSYNKDIPRAHNMQEYADYLSELREKRILHEDNLNKPI